MMTFPEKEIAVPFFFRDVIKKFSIVHFFLLKVMEVTEINAAVQCKNMEHYFLLLSKDFVWFLKIKIFQKELKRIKKYYSIFRILILINFHDYNQITMLFIYFHQKLFIFMKMYFLWIHDYICCFDNICISASRKLSISL